MKTPLATFFSWAFVATLLGAGSGWADNNGFDADQGLSELEALMNVEVVSTSKFSRQLAEIPAAVTVITAEDIRRSNARSIPEALRYVPGIQVTRNTGNNWGVSSRGFHGAFSNKLLVMIDGRSIYSPLFSGVFWDSVDINMQDIERIEVIRGPGSSVWGANAVNGVVNIITRQPDADPGMTFGSDVDSEGYAGGAVKYATELGPGLYGKTSVSYKKQADQVYPAGANDVDHWQSFTTALGLKKQRGESEYGMSAHWTHQKVLDPILGAPQNYQQSNALTNDSGSLVFNYQRQLQANAGLSATLYYSAHDRKSADYDIDDDLVNFDLDNKIDYSRFRWIWGLGYRQHALTLQGKQSFLASSSKVDVQIVSGFVQNEWFVTEESTLTLGVKYEHHRHLETQGFNTHQVLPSLRLLQQLSPNHAFWLAASRSTRVPSVIEHYTTFLLRTAPPLSAANPYPWPLESRVTFNRELEEEKVWIYEAGLRGQLADNLSYDLATYYSDFRNIRGTAPGQASCASTGLPPPQCAATDRIVLPLVFQNATATVTTGAELSARWAVTPAHQLHLGYHYIHMENDTRPGLIPESALSFSPEHQAFLLHDWIFSQHWSSRAGLRYVDHYPQHRVASYEALDLILQYQHNHQLSLRFGARDIFHQGEQEGVIETSQLGAIPREIQTSYFVQVEVRL